MILDLNPQTLGILLGMYCLGIVAGMGLMMWIESRGTKAADQ